jgi:dipeptidase
VYVPILSTATSLPQCLTTGSPQFVDRKTSWWAHRFLANQARLYTPGYYEAIKAAQTKYETIGAHLVETLSRQDDGDLVALFLANHANEVMTAWWQLSDTMMAKFADGFLDQGEPIGFPNKWLTAVGYQNGPTPVPPHANTKGYRNDWTD